MQSLYKRVFEFIALRCPFAQIYFRSVAVVLVVEILVVQIPARLIVIMLVNDVEFLLLGNLPTFLIV